MRVRLYDEPPQPGEHEFRPHITLARDLPRGRTAQKLEKLAMNVNAMKINDFVLVESVRDASGSHYSVLERWPLLS